MVGLNSPFSRTAVVLQQEQEHCPWCEQPITHARFDQISARIAEAERIRLAEQETRLLERFERERHQLSQRAQLEVEAARRDAQEAMAKADAEAAQRSARAAAEANLRVEDALRRGRNEAEAAAAARHRLILDQANARVGVAEAARLAAEKAASERVAEIEKERAMFRRQLQQSNAAHEAEVLARTNEIRESMAQDMSKALLDARAAAFAEKQKLTEVVDDLKRQLEKKSASDLGEGAEIDLFAALARRFDGDVINRVPKGQNGADVVHDVFDNGVLCGRIVYDSKNRSAWQSNFVTKLHSDMIAAKADHAILSTNKFPVGARQLHVSGGVIVASPARVVAVVELLRAHMIQIGALRISAEQREEKTAALYDYITSERYARLMQSLRDSMKKLETVDVEERKAHEATWSKRGRLLNDLDRTRATVATELQNIFNRSHSTAPGDR